MPSTLAVERAADGVTVLRLERPERLNAINEVMLGELRDTLAKLPDDRGTRVVVLTGAGRGFCSGIDMRDFGASMLGPDDPAHRPAAVPGGDGCRCRSCCARSLSRWSRR